MNILCRLIGHNFKPRYNYGAPALASCKGPSAKECLQIMVESKPKTYLHDVCERCGCKNG